MSLLHTPMENLTLAAVIRGPGKLNETESLILWSLAAEMETRINEKRPSSVEKFVDAIFTAAPSWFLKEMFGFSQQNNAEADEIKQVFWKTQQFHSDELLKMVLVYDLLVNELSKSKTLSGRVLYSYDPSKRQIEQLGQTTSDRNFERRLSDNRIVRPAAPKEGGNTTTTTTTTTTTSATVDTNEPKRILFSYDQQRKK